MTKKKKKESDVQKLYMIGFPPGCFHARFYPSDQHSPWRKAAEIGQLTVTAAHTRADKATDCVSSVAQRWAGNWATESFNVQGGIKYPFNHASPTQQQFGMRVTESQHKANSTPVTSHRLLPCKWAAVMTLAWWPALVHIHGGNVWKKSIRDNVVYEGTGVIFWGWVLSGGAGSVSEHVAFWLPDPFAGVFQSTLKGWRTRRSVVFKGETHETQH